MSILAIVLIMSGYLVYALTFSALPHQGLALLLAVVPIYLVSQALRALRLFLLSYDRRIRFGELCWLHIFTVAISRLIPFKLGELVRIVLVGRLLADPTRGLLAVWSERIYDVAMVVVLVGILSFMDGSQWELGVFSILAFVFLFLSFFVFLVLPENLSMLKRYLLLRTDGRGSLRVLQIVDRVHRVVQLAGEMWRSHWATVSWLTVAIWGLEISWLTLLAQYFSGDQSSSLLMLFEITAIESLVWRFDDLVSQVPALALASLVMFHIMVSLGIGAGMVILRRGYLNSERLHAAQVDEVAAS